MAIVAIGIVAGLSVGVGLAMFVILTQLSNRSMAKSSLHVLDEYGTDGITDVREQELSVSLLKRLTPSMGGLSSLGRKYTPVGYMDRVREKVVRSGDTSQAALDRFLAVRVLTAIAAPILFIAVLVFLPASPFLKFACASLFAVVAILGPDSRLNQAVEKREKRIRNDLPSVLDLLTISVEAGLGFDQAVDRVIHAVPGPLSTEFHRMLGQVRAGASRGDALRSMEARIDMPDVRSFLLAIIQADTFGVSIGRVLRSQAEEARIKRRQQAQERALKAPVKMLIPIVLFIFPALFVIVLGPAVINIMDNLA